MSLSICTSCLSRLKLTNFPSPSSQPLTSIAISKSSFHSSVIARNVLMKKSRSMPGVNAPKLRESRSARIKKKGRERIRPPPIGERKAQRKRIILSNPNALEISQIEKLSTESLTNPENVGNMLALDGELLDKLRDAKAFQTTQNWSTFRTPSTLIRKESIELGSCIEAINQSIGKGSSSSTHGLATTDAGSLKGKQDTDKSTPLTIQRIVTGERGSGKSIHLLQAMSMAYLNKWVVINIPNAREFVVNQSSYAPAPTHESSSNEGLYIQPHLTSELLSRIANSNATVLSGLKPTQTHEHLPRSISKTKSLYELAMLGAEEPSVAPSIWQELWKELTVSSKSTEANKGRPALLIAIDGIDHWMGPTKYRTADYEIIHAHQFSLIQQFLGLLFAEKGNALPNGGLVIAATTSSNNPVYLSFELLLRQIEARKSMEPTDKNFPMPQPYEKVDQRVFDLLRGTSYLGLTHLEGLSKPESRGLLEYFARSGVFKEAIDERTVGEQWTLSGGGIIAELCKLGKRVRTGELEIGMKQSTKRRV